MLIKFEKVTKTFPQKILFENASFSVFRSDKCGLVGLNGSGKTTIINMILDEDLDFNGKIEKPSSVEIGCLEQEMYADEDVALFEFCKQAFKEAIEIKKQLTELESKLDDNKKNTELYGKLLEKYEALGGYSIETSVKKVLTGLSFSENDYERSLKSFSGGEKRRAGLAKILLKKPDLLILDEPTNHLDIVAVKWLEDFLKQWDGGLIVISHDRYFLDKIVNRVFEIDNAKVNIYKGNYEQFVKQKKEKIELQQKEYEKQQEYIKKTEDFIRRNIAGQKTKQAQSRRKTLQKMERITPIHEDERKILIDRWNINRSYGHVVHVENLNKEFNGNPVFNGLDLDIYRGEKTALIGANGTGKTTLLKIISGEIKAFDGTAGTGKNVEPFYFTQNLDEITGNISVYDYIHGKIPMATELEVRNLLAWFYFKGDSVYTVLDNLSGGEKSRVMTLNLLLSGANFLLLDEPTNHLDIYTRESLAEALNEYPGSVLFVSHDRYFIDSVADKVYVLNNGKLEKLSGNFMENEDEILAMFKSNDADAKNESKNKLQNNKCGENETSDSSGKRKNVNVYKINEIEKRISEIENEIEELEKAKFKEENYKDGVKMKEIEDNVKRLNELLENKMMEWEKYHG